MTEITKAICDYAPVYLYKFFSFFLFFILLLKNKLFYTYLSSTACKNISIILFTFLNTKLLVRVSTCYVNWFSTWFLSIKIRLKQVCELFLYFVVITFIKFRVILILKIQYISPGLKQNIRHLNCIRKTLLQ